MIAILKKNNLLNAKHYEFIYSGKRYKLLSNKNEDELKILLKKAIEYLNDQDNVSGVDTSIFIALMNSIDDRLRIEENYNFLKTKYLLCSKQNDDLSKKITSLEKRLYKTEKNINKLSQESEKLSQKLSLYDNLASESDLENKMEFCNKSNNKNFKETPFEDYFDVDLKNYTSIKPILDRDNLRNMRVDIPRDELYFNNDTSLFDYLIELENNN